MTIETYRSPSIDTRVLELFALVGDGFVGAREALIHGDVSISTLLIDREKRIDRLYNSLQKEVSERLLTGGLEPAEIQYLVGVIRIIPELERSGDLAEHIARKAALDLSRDLRPRCRGIMQQMGEVGTLMWNQASIAYDTRDATIAGMLGEMDESLDDLHVSFIAEVVSSSPPATVAMELALVGRFLERFGDHAVNLARTVAAITTPLRLAAD